MSQTAESDVARYLWLVSFCSATRTS